MRFVILAGFCICVSLTVCAAQENEIGGAGGFGFYHDATITNTAGTARAGFGPRFAIGVVLGHSLPHHFGIEARYTFQDGDSELRSGSVEANLDAHAQSALGEFLWYPSKTKAKWRPFGAAGGGIKVYQATEPPAGPRPLANFATLVDGSPARPLITIGGGIEYLASEHWLFRADIRDYATPFPTKLFTLAPAASLKGWLHDFVPMIGFSRRF